MQIVTAESRKKGARVFSNEIDFGLTINDSVDLFGEALCKNKLDAQLKVDAQGVARRMMKAGKTDKEILEFFQTWEPSLQKAGKSTTEKADDLWGKLTKEEKAAMLKKWGGKK